nr:chloroplast ribosomal protein S16 [Hypericum ascyron]
MAVKIRLARHGNQNRPFYRIVVADQRKPRDGRYIKIIGFYNPLAAKDDPKRISLNFEAARYWLSVGAQPTDPVRVFLLRAGLLSPPPMVVNAQTDGPSKGSAFDSSTE